RPCSDVRSNRHEARESGTNSGINDCYSTTSRNVSLIEGKLHLAEVIERHNAIGVIRNNLVGKAVNQVGVICLHSKRNGFKEPSLEILLKRTGLFNCTGSSQTLDLSTVFTEIIGHVPSVTNIVGNTHSDLAGFNRVVDQRSI